MKREEWLLLIRKTGELDINLGGYCDARAGCINFWAGPEDKPEGKGVLHV